MQVFLKYLPNEDGVKEWAIVELQGDLGSREEDCLDGQFVGDLYYNRDGSPILIIGHHILFGKVQKLEKPYAVLEKVPAMNDREESSSSTSSGGSSIRRELEVKCIIKRKLCFRERPKPIVGSFVSSRKSDDTDE